MIQRLTLLKNINLYQIRELSRPIDKYFNILIKYLYLRH